ncbi:recombination regulator RecX [Frankia sp. CcI156]|uniref:Regulatory protein RecX n=2 Tax=Frankia casuarinae (strain DSM 45818 / CECT 9043 / HFP020203 / CcI3) TaxID=106370 RepID=Q2J765_FRACC|nr:MULTISPECIES: recombination regulator RecX [Frankia]ABD12877.1 regulatory protein RecX [Frankia casuarinae]ETA03335.1 hypothetical protein CcI6DRAFT_01299 [Frankia sp. CcI6]EYT92727.1 hypothetical protein ThrDRAFT_01682 [Frankia casuarinae]KDA43662.1 hypothetical protein BMG523Draft_01567 [Frankia sp. BMG5.23]KFB05127.1 hypothetical protein ALLO2DRAFT_02186 [Frankia sp. Allo2]
MAGADPGNAAAGPSFARTVVVVDGGPRPKDPISVAREICLHQLATRARSRAELAATMRRRGVTDEIAAVVLDRLAAVGLIDDEAFAAAFVSSARARRGLGRQALATELRKRGVDPDTVEAAMALVGADDEEESARELVLRRLRSMDRLPEQVRTRRLLAMLTRKGYPVELAVRVVSEQVAQGPDGGGRMGWVVDGDEDDGSV